MTAPFDYARASSELDWILKHGDVFEERPATIREFVGKDYLNIEGKVRPAVMEELSTIIGKKVRSDRITAFPRAMFTGAIGIGKTTVASIVLPYLAHWVLCLKDPQDFFDLLPGSRIAFMQMSTSEKQAKEVVFGDIKARILYSPWFQDKYPYDPNFKNQLRFSKDIWILPGDSEETTFEGYNILGGILDEADSHKVTDSKDYAEEGYTTIHSRIDSRFGDRGFLLVIGQMKRSTGFAARKFAEMQKDKQAHAVRMTIWESFGWAKYTRPDGTRDSFFYDPERHEIVPSGVVAMLDEGKSAKMIEVPNVFRQDFENNPEKALRDLAGIPPATGSPFISLTYKILECRDRWEKRYPDTPSPANTSATMPSLASWFKAPDTLKRVIHLDMAYSPNGDALGFAMGHVSDMIEVDDERKPFIVFDLLMRIHAPAGREIFLGDIRRLIYELRDEHKFKISRVTMDGFQSTDTRQQLERKHIWTELISVDKSLLPYHDLREAIYENRMAFPRYMCKLRENDVELVEIAVKELIELSDDGKKVDHPEGGSKDVADAMAGVTYTLMGDRTYHRKKREAPVADKVEQTAEGGVRITHPSLQDPRSVMTAPVPHPSLAPGLSPTWRPPIPRRQP
jgi:hypothetical protein